MPIGRALDEILGHPRVGARAIRVLVISREIPPVGGGAGRVALDLADHLTSRDHDVDLLTMHHGSLPHLERRGRLVIHRIRAGRRHRDSAGMPSMARFLMGARRLALRLTQDERFDLVHAHAIVPDGLAGRAVARWRGVPLVVTAHGTDVPGYDERRFRLTHKIISPIWRGVARNADLLTTPSEYLKGLITTQAPNAEVVVIPNGIKTDLFRDRPKDSTFLIVSRLVARKNHAAFFAALHSVPQAEVHVVGEGPELPTLMSLAEKTHHAVTFHGWLDHGSSRWRDLYERSRFFVSPSLAENFPVSLLEAQLARMTVLATPIAGNKEVLGETAIYFDDPSPAAIGRTLQWALAQDAAVLDDIGRRARERVISRFSWDAVTDRFVQGFSDVVGGRNHR